MRCSQAGRGRSRSRGGWFLVALGAALFHCTALCKALRISLGLRQETPRSTEEMREVRLIRPAQLAQPALLSLPNSACLHVYMYVYMYVIQ